MVVNTTWMLVTSVLSLGVSGGTKPTDSATVSVLPSVSVSAPSTGPSYHWQDFDRDGAPDVYVQSPGQDRLLRNAGGRFEDYRALSGPIPWFLREAGIARSLADGAQPSRPGFGERR